jgi:hypothetical protein
MSARKAPSQATAEAPDRQAAFREIRDDLNSIVCRLICASETLRTWNSENSGRAAAVIFDCADELQELEETLDLFSMDHLRQEVHS